MSFLDDIKAFREQALQDASQSVNKLVHNLFTEVVARSPSPSNPGQFAKGLLVNQWYPTVGGGYSTELGTLTNDIGVDSLSRISKALSQNPFLGKDNTISLTNNTEEAYYAEVLGWPEGLGTNGWNWRGNTGPYMMIANSVQSVIGAYS
jgi:hypothetical protein